MADSNHKWDKTIHAAYFRPEEWQDTLALLSERIEQNPNDADSWSNRGLILKQLGDHKGATNDFNESLRLNPNSFHALLWQGDLDTNLGQYSEAMAKYNRAIAIDPMSAYAYSHRGNSYLDQELFSEAIADFTKAIELRPEWSQPYFERARARSTQSIKDYQGALADYDMFFRIEHDCVEMIAIAHGLRAFVYVDLGLLHEAIDDLCMKIQLASGDAYDYLSRSKLYMMVGDSLRSTEDRKKAIELNPLILEEN